MAVAGPHGCRNYQADQKVFDQLRLGKITNGTVVQCVVQQGKVVSLEELLFTSGVEQWKDNVAYVRTPFLPQVQLGPGDKVITKCKILFNSKSHLSNLVFSPKKVGLKGINKSSKLDFCTCIALRGLQRTVNPPCLDVLPIKMCFCEEQPAEYQCYYEPIPSSHQASNVRKRNWMESRMRATPSGVVEEKTNYRPSTPRSHKGPTKRAARTPTRPVPPSPSARFARPPDRGRPTNSGKNTPRSTNSGRNTPKAETLRGRPTAAETQRRWSRAEATKNSRLRKPKPVPQQQRRHTDPALPMVRGPRPSPSISQRSSVRSQYSRSGSIMSNASSTPRNSGSLGQRNSSSLGPSSQGKPGRFQMRNISQPSPRHKMRLPPGLPMPPLGLDIPELPEDLDLTQGQDSPKTSTRSGQVTIHSYNDNLPSLGDAGRLSSPRLIIPSDIADNLPTLPGMPEDIPGLVGDNRPQSRDQPRRPSCHDEQSGQLPIENTLGKMYRMFAITPQGPPTPGVPPSTEAAPRRLASKLSRSSDPGPRIRTPQVSPANSNNLPLLPEVSPAHSVRSDLNSYFAFDAKDSKGPALDMDKWLVTEDGGADRRTNSWTGRGNRPARDAAPSAQTPSTPSFQLRAQAPEFTLRAGAPEFAPGRAVSTRSMPSMSGFYGLHQPSMSWGSAITHHSRANSDAINAQSAMGSRTTSLESNIPRTTSLESNMTDKRLSDALPRVSTMTNNSETFSRTELSQMQGNSQSSLSMPRNSGKSDPRYSGVSNSVMKGLTPRNSDEKVSGVCAMDAMIQKGLTPRNSDGTVNKQFLQAAFGPGRIVEQTQLQIQLDDALQAPLPEGKVTKMEAAEAERRLEAVLHKELLDDDASDFRPEEVIRESIFSAVPPNEMMGLIPPPRPPEDEQNLEDAPT